MRKPILFLILVAMSCSLFGCSGVTTSIDENTTTTATGTENEETTTEEATTEEPTTEEPTTEEPTTEAILDDGKLSIYMPAAQKAYMQKRHYQSQSPNIFCLYKLFHRVQPHSFCL